mmetsp:Transcript_26060/g.47096  ORF Transcript_26060/g.47096 Transcript_26060/m.47096 type:complete len:114 (+) Transcript_26060:764-1105(+)
MTRIGKGAKKFYVTFAKMLHSLVNLEALRLYHFPDGNVWHHVSSWLQANNKLTSIHRLTALTVSFNLISPLSAYRQVARACTVLFPAMEELILEYLMRQSGIGRPRFRSVHRM